MAKYTIESRYKAGSLLAKEFGWQAIWRFWAERETFEGAKQDVARFNKMYQFREFRLKEGV